MPAATVVDTEAVAGGGSLPGLEIPSAAVAIASRTARTIATNLRLARVIVRVDDDRVICDLRTVDPEDDERLTAALLIATAEH